jgi:hypothetical protein
MAALTRNTQVATISGSSVEVTNGMAVGQKYALISTTDCWFRVAATGTAAVAAAANNVYLPAGVYVEIKADSATVAFVSAIQASAGGTLNLILLEG